MSKQFANAESVPTRVLQTVVCSDQSVRIQPPEANCPRKETKKCVNSTVYWRIFTHIVKHSDNAIRIVTVTKWFVAWTLLKANIAFQLNRLESSLAFILQGPRVSVFIQSFLEIYIHINIHIYIITPG